jgi:uncharacterized protein (DUF58 family)
MSPSPSIVPHTPADRDIYIVLDDFGSMLGRAWRETAEEDTGRATLIQYLLEGHYNNPVRIVAFNTAEGWARDVTREIADELRYRCAELEHVPDALQVLLGR